jgi:polygalacturonase
VVVTGVTLREGPYWHMQFVYCQDVLVDGVTVTGLQAQNIDGVIIDSCKRVRISNCSIAAGSDPIALKSGYNEDGRRVNLPCEDVVITNCNLLFSVGAGISLGSETAGGIRNVLISNCTIAHSRYGVHIRSPRGRGGVVERIRMANITMEDISETALMITHFYDSVRQDSLFGEPPATGNPETDRAVKLPVGEGTPAFRDLDFSSLSVGPVPTVGVIEGLPERFIEGLALRDLDAPAAGTGLLCTRAADLTISRASLVTSKGPAIAARDVDRLEIQGLRGRARDEAVRLENVRGAFIHGCSASARELVRLEGQRNRDVRLGANADVKA